ncbi:C4-dicarboxylate transporter DctA [Prosthecobacter sp.]|uniref:C4-dicarboxylate transporter DctA n=1 Tax=Prosthecobacter sp. TaxID=1965333 RepID=UPI00378425E0
MKWLKNLYVQVLVGIVLGILMGYLWPAESIPMKTLGVAFVNAVKMLIAPIIFCTIVHGIAGMGDLKKLGSVGWKALLYFEVVTTVALIIGLMVAKGIQPGSGMHVNPADIVLSAEDQKDFDKYTKAGEEMTVTGHLLQIIPKTFVSAFSEGEILQVLFVAILAGVALARLGERARPITHLLDSVAQMFFGIVGIVTKAAPIAAFGAMAFVIGKFGFGALGNLIMLMACVYLTCVLFVFVVLGAIAWWHGFSLWKILKHIKEELLLTLGTSSSEAALPGLMRKMEKSGCSDGVVGIVLPAGYSFNLDGTSIYLTMAALFVAQATDIPLTLMQELSILGILLLTSKGAAAVTGGGFITLAATLGATHTIPVAGLALIMGIDRFLSEARAITNLIGNTVAMLVVAKWENEFDAEAGKMLLR